MYKELTIDGVLGRVVALGPMRLRVLEVDPATGKARLCHAQDETVRVTASWPILRNYIAEGTAIVE